MVGHQHTARHSLQHASKELRGHNLLRTDCNLVLLSVPQTVFRQQRQRALGYGSSRLGAYDARTRGMRSGAAFRELDTAAGDMQQ